jgi:hypothetical protein
MTIREAIEQAIREVKPELDHEVVFKFARGLMAEESDDNWLDELVPAGCDSEAIAFFKACFTGEPVNHPPTDRLIRQFRMNGARRSTEQSRRN